MQEGKKWNQPLFVNKCISEKNILFLGTINSTGDINSQSMSQKSLVRSKETFWPGLKREYLLQC